MNTDNVLIIIPAFNEESYIGDVIKDVRRLYPSIDILVVDDNSSDATASIAGALGCVVLKHPVNLGDGSARHTGYLFALKKGYWYVVQLDADGQHKPAYIEELLLPLLRDDADIIIGSRFLQKTSYKNTFLKNIGVFVFGRIASLFSGIKITDSTSGFRAVNRKVIEAYCTQGFYPSRYPDADLIIVSRRAGFRIKEIPVEMRENRKPTPLHHGTGTVFYVFKMLLSIIVTVLREKPKGGRAP